MIRNKFATWSKVSEASRRIPPPRWEANLFKILQTQPVDQLNCECDFCQELILLTNKKLLETNGNQSLPIVSNFAWANSAIGVFILPSALQLNSIPNVGKKNYANANGFNSNM